MKPVSTRDLEFAFIYIYVYLCKYLSIRFYAHLTANALSLLGKAVIHFYMS